MSSSLLFEHLVEIMARLRNTENGCPWDLRQDFTTIAPYTIEEAYEVADAIERSDYSALCDELGDLLFQIVFHARMAEEKNYFNITDVCRVITDKMSRRHPHIFGDEDIATADGVAKRWDEIKADEREKKLYDSHLDGMTRSLPALKFAQKMQRRAAGIGFDWPEVSGVWDKFQEELDELKQAVLSEDKQAIRDEIGDLLFTCVNLSRHLGVDAEDALRQSSRKFENRFRHMEAVSKQSDRSLEELDTVEMERLWGISKKNI